MAPFPPDETRQGIDAAPVARYPAVAIEGGPDSAVLTADWISLPGPTLLTWAVQRVGSYLRYTGRGADSVARAARDPLPTSPC